MSAFCATVLFISSSVQAADPAGLSRLGWLIGDWAGEGNGEPGHSNSERHAALVLEGRFLRVEGRSIYAKQPANPKGETHVQTDMWGYDRERKALTLRQFDSLGFASMYVLDNAASSSTRWVLNAEQLENVPKGWRARYVYSLISATVYEETLELDTDGKGFKPYVSNRFMKNERK